MLLLVNANRMQPPIAPLGIDYLAGAVRRAGLRARVCDLGLTDDPAATLRWALDAQEPTLVGLSIRNTDDCFWPSAEWFVPGVAALVATIRDLSPAPVVLGGLGFSIFAEQLMAATHADFGIRGDGEQAAVALVHELHGGRRFQTVPGLLWRDRGRLRANAPAWPRALDVPTQRNSVDNPTYFRRGGQIGLETKRGCGRSCIYCADPLAKGRAARLRPPADVADEAEALLAQRADVLHLCDSEFNLPVEHARAVCDELIHRGLGRRLRWYTYCALAPFDARLARAMRDAGCVGVNFTADAAAPEMLAVYRQLHRREDIAIAVRLCRENGMAAMLDLLLGGPGETPETVAETIAFVKETGPDAAGAALGVRIYPGTAMAELVHAEGPLDANPNLHRRYDGPVDFFRPTFYISRHLGERPAEQVREFIGGDVRFFAPADPAADYNYNDNRPLIDAIEAGARGAYWHILRQLRA